MMRESFSSWAVWGDLADAGISSSLLTLLETVYLPVGHIHG